MSPRTQAARRRRPRHRGPRVTFAVSPAAPAPVDRFGRSVLWAFIVLSLALHFTGGALSEHFFGILRSRLTRSVQKIEVAVVERPRPPPPPPPKIEPPKPEPPKPVVQHKPIPLPRPPPDAPPPPKDLKPLPPPPTAEAPKPTPAPVVIPGLTLSSTSATGSFAVSVGNTFGAPGKYAANPADVKPYKAEHYAAAYAITENPVDLNNLTDDEMRKFYPPEALKDQLEAEVRAKITIDDDGSVVKVVILEAAGHGFDDAARKLLMKKRFKPAKVNGQVVATEIPFTLHFELPP